MTRAELMARISNRELMQWWCLYNLEPWGETQQEYRAAQIASVIAETHRNEKKRKEPFKTVEFMREMYLEKQEKQETDPDKALFEKAKAIFGTLGARKKD